MNFAETVKTGDPDRHLAAMAAKPDDRAKLLVLYAFNLEIARAPWASVEPMISEMRLQWWRDSIGNIFDGKTPISHEILTPLADIIKRHNLPHDVFEKMILVRQFDVYADPHSDDNAFDRYIYESSGGLTELAARILTSGDLEFSAAKDIGYAIGVANLLRAAPALLARGKNPLPVELPAILDKALSRLNSKPPQDTFFAVLAGWRARYTLNTARSDPNKVTKGLLLESPAWRRFSFMKCRLTGRI